VPESSLTLQERIDYAPIIGGNRSWRSSQHDTRFVGVMPPDNP